jgi:hypothetical protein
MSPAILWKHQSLIFIVGLYSMINPAILLVKPIHYYIFARFQKRYVGTFFCNHLKFKKLINLFS